MHWQNSVRFDVRVVLRRACVAVLALHAGACSVADGSAGTGERYRPGAEVERLESLALAGEDVGLVRDFDLTGDTLYLLDGAGRVHVAERRDDAWALAGSFGRAGGGPGEFLTATGISVDSTSIAVIDNTRLQFFTRRGEHRDFRLLHLPCPMLRAGVAHGGAGLYVHGTCARGSFVTDTMKAVLAWSPDTSDWQIVAEDLRYTRDGSAGHLFTASSALTPGGAGVHLFGSGATNCVWLISDAVRPPEAAPQCPIARGLYSADPPPGLRERLRSGAVGGARLEWPGTLPIYLERIRISGTTVLIRPWSADSAVVQESAPSGRDVGVVPLDGLIGCKAAGCLWLLTDSLPARVIVLDSAALRRRLRPDR